jgi:hypothetical protein
MEHSFLKKVIVTSFFISMALIARESDEHVDQLRVGNFAVRGTTQPGPMFGFGQNIIDQYSGLAVAYPFVIFGKNKVFAELAPEIIYGLRDDLSILLAFPTALKVTYDGHHSSGSLDTVLQVEYAPYAQHKQTETNQISFVGSMFFPTGDECKNPPTGFGSPSFFLGVIGLHLATEWYAYTSYGVLLPTKSNNIKPGNHFLYQAGFGKNIAYKSEKWTLMWMLEMNGTYEQRTKTNGVIDNNSGDNTVILGPSLWFSTNRFVLEAGVAPVISQHFFGNQTVLKSTVTFSLYTGFRFN